jgi:hypothetical protein
VVRQRSAKPPSPSSNLGAAFNRNPQSITDGGFVISGCGKLNDANLIKLASFSEENSSKMNERKDPYRRVDAAINRVNQGKLKAMPVSLSRLGGSLYVQGTFPPKSGELVATRRRVPLKLKASVDFMFEAQNRAIQIGADLMLGKWAWTDEKTIERLPITVAQFADLHRKGYLDRNGKPDTQQDTLSY